MTLKLFLQLIILWFTIALLGFINGSIRDATYLSLVGDLRAHQIATFTLSALVFSDIYLFLRKKVKKLNSKTLFLIGLTLVIFTALFEFGFGHFILKAPWSKLLNDYNFLKGRVWGMFLLVQLFSPILIKQISNNLRK
jgi:hypothetical protein